ncbi:MAG TPA: AtpZ/AtpI family protein [Acidobacteriaceae bacterium]|nr:AtpZ/AtpI family protein [Acidobacteriaceae bacterium]
MPASSQPGKESSSSSERRTVLGGLVRAESLLQIALILPLSAIIGWVLGDAIGRHFHTAWPAIVGLLFGVIAGFIQMIRIANKANRTNN